MAENLTFTHVIYDPGNLHAEWLALIPPRFTGFQVALTEAGNPPQYFQTQVPSIDIGQTLEPTKTYTLTVTVMVSGEPTSQSETVTLITAAPVVSLVDNSGLSLLLQWGPAQGTAITGYLALLVEEMRQSWTQTTDPATFTTTFQQQLLPTARYTVSVRATGEEGVVLGPPSQVLAPITTAPTITSASNDVTETNIWWIAAQGDQIEGYAANLLREGGSSSWQYTDGSARRTTFHQQLDPAFQYTVTVRATDANLIVFGPPSQILTMITGSPTIIMVDNGGQNILMRWTGAGEGIIDGYLAMLEQTGSQRWSQSTDADTLQTTFNVQLSVEALYTIVVRATNSNNIVLGPPSQVLVPIAGAPGITMVDNSGHNVRYDWTAAQGAGVEGYLALLMQTGGSLWTQSTDKDTLTATFGQALSPANAYTTAVRGMNSGGIVLGPPSEILTPITTTPRNPTVNTTGTQIMVGWSADTNPIVTSYVADLFRDEASQGKQQVQGSPAIYTQPMAQGSIYTGTVRSGGDKLLGPWTELAIGPYAVDTAFAYDPFGRLATTTWNGANRITYTYDDAGNITSAQKSATPEI